MQGLASRIGIKGATASWRKGKRPVGGEPVPSSGTGVGDKSAFARASAPDGVKERSTCDEAQRPPQAAASPVRDSYDAAAKGATTASRSDVADRTADGANALLSTVRRNDYKIIRDLRELGDALRNEGSSARASLIDEAAKRLAEHTLMNSL